MHVVGIGLANIDLISHVGDDFLKKYQLVKGQAKKLPVEDFSMLRGALKDIHVEAGGCVGNTLCGLDKTNIKATFFGKIGNDDYAKIYRSSFQEHDVLFPVTGGEMDSSQCAVLITPEGERTFAYMHGASWTLAPDDLYFESITQANLVYTEVYAMAFGMKTGLWPALINHLRRTGVKMAMKIVDREYVDLYRTAIFALAEEGILSLVVGNKDNVCSLARRDTIEESFQLLGQWKCATLLTDGGNGAYYNFDGDTYHHRVEMIENPVNTSGAGDQFMAGFLENWLFNSPIETCMESASEKAKSVLMCDAPRT